MSFTFQATGIKKIFVSEGEPESVRLAVSDLIKDIRSVCGGAELTASEADADIVVATTPERFSHEEEFCYEIKNQIRLTGADDFGTMWAIYTFSERELKIPPFYLFDGITVEKKAKLVLAEKTVREYPHTKFRGWFINDEDLLTAFQNQGVRMIVYKFYHEIIHPDMMEKIAETALRFRMNLIIPATFVDILNPDEENLVRIASRRGLYVSQHHIEPLGVSGYILGRYMAEHGYPEDTTYTKNPDAMAACWKEYARKWAKYPRVVWQLGLRGKGDVPVWASDKNVGSSDKERGELISRAIATQYEIIKAATGQKKIYTTSTVWMEGADLLKSGHLTLPKDTTAVFADVGITQMFGDDFFKVPREEGRTYGVYYHAQYWGLGPHLAEGVLPQKMEYSYALARKSKSDYYSIMNVGNIREFTFSIDLNSKIAWYGESKSAEEIMTGYCSLYAGEHADAMKRAIETYFDALCYDAEERNYSIFCKKHDFSYHKYENLPFPTLTVTDGLMAFVNHILFQDRCGFYTPQMRELVLRGQSVMQLALAQFMELKAKLPEGYQKALLRGWCHAAFFWERLFGISVENAAAVEIEQSGSNEKISPHIAKAAQYAKNILDTREEWFDGEWSGWFRGDSKIDYPFLHSFYKRELARLIELGR